MSTSITHHPPDETVLSYATGTLLPGPSLVVATHLSFCEACRRRADAFEMVGGAMIDALPPTALEPDALASALARLDAPGPGSISAGHATAQSLADARTDAAGGAAARSATRSAAGGRDSGEEVAHGDIGANAKASRPARLVRPAPSTLPALPEGVEWPSPLRHYEIGRWRFLAPGVQCSAVTVPGQRQGHQVLLLRAGPGTLLPAHGHRGTEYTCVLAGSFSDQGGRFGAGDMIETGVDVDHQPITGPESDCVCLLAMEGRLRLHGLLGRLLQPLLRV